ncbi:MAG: YhfC family glutamic-type intramembrane protease [Chloroflexota bacterium]|jgi:uncharacterized membrane protein YhfC
MVDQLSIIFMVISLLIAFALPIGTAIFLYVKQRISIVAILVGVLGFLVPQVLIRFQLLGLLAPTEFYQSLIARPFLLGLFLSVTAGLFEETGRWIGFRYLLKNRLERKNALAYGVGHGGFEAIILVGMAYVVNLIYSLAINDGTFDSVIAPQLGINAEPVRISLIATPAYLFLVGGIERAFAFSIQLGLSVLVYLSVRKNQPGLFWLAILLHTLVNLPAVMLASANVSVLWIELWVGFCAAVAIWFVINSKKYDPPEAAEQSLPDRNENG